VATITLSRDDRDTSRRVALVNQRRGDWLQLAWEGERAWVLGWVPATHVRTAEAGRAFGYLGAGADPSAPHDDLVGSDPLAAICAWNAPLIVEERGRRWHVGELAPGTPITTGVGDARWVRVTDPALAARLPLWIPRARAYRCHDP
jgi:hypothetical protein